VWTAIVAHPTKAAALSAKAGDKVSRYDIADDATWANKVLLSFPLKQCGGAKPATPPLDQSVSLTQLA
jgi:hypothetical protein